MQQYNADAIEVLTGLDPVRKRPGMYTDTSRPNHLAQEVIDNSVDEAIAGHARHIEVTLHKDNSLTVSDDGRGMPVDIHAEQGKPGVEVIHDPSCRWKIFRSKLPVFRRTTWCWRIRCQCAFSGAGCYCEARFAGLANVF